MSLMFVFRAIKSYRFIKDETYIDMMPLALPSLLCTDSVSEKPKHDKNGTAIDD